MKRVKGIWLPSSELHYAESDGLGDRYIALDLALTHLPVERRRTALDVGAHVGLWSRWLVQYFDQVEAFEPVLEYGEILAKNLNGSPNYRLHNVALGAFYDHVGMKTYEENTGQTHVSGWGMHLMRPLDAYHCKDVDLVKIDVEGFEFEVLLGARKTLCESKPVVVIEERGLGVKNFGAERENMALDFLDMLGMKKLAEDGHDYVMGWQ